MLTYLTRNIRKVKQHLRCIKLSCCIYPSVTVISPPTHINIKALTCLCTAHFSLQTLPFPSLPFCKRISSEGLSWRNPILSGPNPAQHRQFSATAERFCGGTPMLFRLPSSKTLSATAIFASKRNFRGFSTPEFPFLLPIWLALMAAVRELGVNQNKPTPEILVGGISPGSAATYDWLSVRKHRGNQWGRASFVKGLRGVLPS